VLYGLFGRIFGWHRHSAVILNLIAFSAAGWAWVSLTRLNVARLLLSGLTLVTFWHVVFWAPTGMQESLHHAGAIVMAACFASALGPAHRRWITVAGWTVLGVLSFIRPSWILLLPLWAFVTARQAQRPVLIATVAGSFVYGAAILFAYGSTTAPYENGLLLSESGHAVPGPRALAENVMSNVSRLASPDQFHPIELLERYQYVALLVSTAALAVVATRARRPAPHLTVAAVSLTMAFVAMLPAVPVHQTTPSTGCSRPFCFLVSCCASPPLGGSARCWSRASSCPTWSAPGTSLIEFEDIWRDRFTWDRRGVFELERALDGTVVYRPEASRWCNTLLTSSIPRT
jgi:hypothetical protein